MARSAEKILSWRSQFHRLERWFARLAPSESVSDIERLDFYLAYFMNCYALRDWSIKSRAISAAQIDEMIGKNDSMRLCRDICNRSKHLVISSPSTDADFQIFREYNFYDTTTRWVIFANTAKLDLFDVASSAMSFWKQFIESYGPEEPPDPFARDVGKSVD
jgi:hypothetical protein